MFKIITLTALSLIFSQAAFASYNCHNGAETLKVVHAGYSADGKKTMVTATLTGSGPEQVFTGTYKLSNDAAGPYGYSLTTAQGEPVGLEMKVVQSYGGRCGRCGDSSTTTYALLTLPQAETVDFLCD
jgi:hypothetical protein